MTNRHSAQNPQPQFGYPRWWRKCLALITILVITIGGSLEVVTIRADDPVPAGPPCQNAPLPIDLPTALQMVDASNPTVALARERVREAYARLREAQANFLPNLYAGPQYNRHDGLIQNSRGQIFNTDKWNFFIGGGAALEWDTPNLLFAPLIARRVIDAQAAAARAVSADVQLDVASTYLDLLRGYAQLAINADTLSRAEEMLRNADTADKAGKTKSPADITRARSEVDLRREERIVLTGQVGAISARLTQLLLLDPTVELVPADPLVLPIMLVPHDTPLQELVSIGLTNRPELAEGRAYVGAAQGRLRQAQVSPLVPKLDVIYTGNEFGGAATDQRQLFGGRSDGTAMATWKLSGMGFGDLAQIKERRSQVNEASLHIREIEAQVAADVAAAARLSSARQSALGNAQKAVQHALETWDRLQKMSFGLTGRDGRYDPLEPLLAEQALDTARTRYLTEVIEFNRAQFRLYWALGNPPMCALPHASPLAVEVPVVPQPRPAGPPGR